MYTIQINNVNHHVDGKYTEIILRALLAQGDIKHEKSFAFRCDQFDYKDISFTVYVHNDEKSVMIDYTFETDLLPTVQNKSKGQKLVSQINNGPYSWHMHEHGWTSELRFSITKQFKDDYPVDQMIRETVALLEYARSQVPVINSAIYEGGNNA